MIVAECEPAGIWTDKAKGCNCKENGIVPVSVCFRPTALYMREQLSSLHTYMYHMHSMQPSVKEVFSEVC